MNKRYYEHTLPIIRGSLSNTYVTEANTESQGWCVCCFEVQRNAPKMSSKNGRKQNEKAQKAKNREEKGSVNDFIGLLIPAPFFFEGYASENYHWRENPQKMPSNQRKDTEQSYGRSVSFSRCVVWTFHIISKPQVHT